MSGTIFVMQLPRLVVFVDLIQQTFVLWPPAQQIDSLLWVNYDMRLVYFEHYVIGRKLQVLDFACPASRLGTSRHFCLVTNQVKMIVKYLRNHQLFEGRGMIRSDVEHLTIDSASSFGHCYVSLAQVVDVHPRPSLSA